MDTVRKKVFLAGEVWSRITEPKEKGGLGIKELRRMNVNLLYKWWWKVENGTGIWRKIVHKYLKKGGHNTS